MKLHFPFGQPPAGEEVYWRVEARRYSYILDAEREEYGVTPVRLEAFWWRVKHRTPMGVRLRGIDRVVIHSHRKRYACPTLEEAIESFRARKKRQIALLRGQLSAAKQELKLLENQSTLDIPV